MRVSTAAVLVLVVACGGSPSTDTGETTTSPPTPTAASTTVPTTAVAPSSIATTVPTTPADDVVDIAVVITGSSVEVAVEGQPQDGRVAVGIGDQVRITIESDVADEVHVHTYDVAVDVAPGTPGVIEFAADIPGIFEVELEDSHRPLFDLEVA